MTRTSRDLEDREHETRKEEWNPASTLPQPDPMDGWRFKWVRRLVLGETDIMNMSKRRREGWEPVAKEEQPDLAAFSDNEAVIEVGGLVLCKMPEERAEARDRYYADKAEGQLTGLNQSFAREARADNRLAPTFEERTTKVSRQG
jgi:hypothetical protein